MFFLPTLFLLDQWNTSTTIWKTLASKCSKIVLGNQNIERTDQHCGIILLGTAYCDGFQEELATNDSSRTYNSNFKSEEKHVFAVTPNSGKHQKAFSRSLFAICRPVYWFRSNKISARSENRLLCLFTMVFIKCCGSMNFVYSSKLWHLYCFFTSYNILCVYILGP